MYKLSKHYLQQESLLIVKGTEMKYRILGVASAIHSFEFLYRFVLGEVLLLHSDNLTRTLLSQEMSAAEGQKNCGNDYSHN